jgi:hypothetical protein
LVSTEFLNITNYNNIAEIVNDTQRNSFSISFGIEHQPLWIEVMQCKETDGTLF